MDAKPFVFLGAGVAVGYVTAKKLLIKQFNERLEYELQKTREFYDARYGVDENEKNPRFTDIFNDNVVELTEEESAAEGEIVESVAQLTKPAARALVNYQQGPTLVTKEATESEEAQQELPILSTDDGPDFSIRPTEDEDERYIEPPYIIDKDAFFENEADYEQITLTYYQGDSTLANQSDEVMDSEWTFSHTGFQNLVGFGEKSGDPNIVYVRCEKFRQDFEICRSAGKYAVEVAGLD